MKKVNGKNHVEVKDKRREVHPNENILLRERKTPTSLRTQYRLQNGTKHGKNQ